MTSFTPNSKMIRRCRPLLGTYFELTLDEAKDAAHLIDLVFKEAERLTAIFNFHDPESELAGINSLIPGQIFEASREMFEVLECAQQLCSATQGRFNVALPHRWEEGHLPAYELFGDRFLIKLRNARVDLSGMAKGYIVDACVKRVLVANPNANGIVNAGGDLRVFGNPQEIWIRIGARETSVLKSIHLCNQALATSTVQPFGETSHRDPLTGQRLTHVQTASAVAESCLLADAFTKIVLLLPETSSALLAQQYGVIAEVAS